MKDIVKFALELATNGHEGQTRNDKATPYITHPIAVREIALHYISVMNNIGVPALHSYDIPFEVIKTAIEIVALLHDGPEDSGHRGFTAHFIVNRLQSNFSKNYPNDFFIVILNALISVTHSDPKENYLDYILRAKKDDIARVIKLSDISHNLSTLDHSDKKNKHKIDKYKLAQYILLKE